MKFPFALYGKPFGSGKTTNVGKLSPSDAQPYESQAPSEGNPGHQKTCVHHVAGRAMDVRLRAHGHEESQVVDAAGQVREKRC